MTKIAGDITMKHILVLIIIVMGFYAGCKEIVVEPPEPELFDIEYWFINHGDPDIRAASIRSLTYYPNIDSSNYGYTLFQTPAIDDTLRQIIPMKGYIGCRTQMAISINKIWMPDTEPCWRYFYFDEIDTIKKVSDRITIFSWPQDTTRAIHEYIDQIGYCKP